MVLLMVKINMTKFLIYVLGLENNKYYVGLTSQAKGAENRFNEHLDTTSGLSSKWCSLHKPLTIIREVKLRTTDYSKALRREAEVTVDLVKKYGKENVRGATACSPDQDKFNQSYDQLLSSLRYSRKLDMDRLALYKRFAKVKRGDHFYHAGDDGTEFSKVVVDVERTREEGAMFFLTDTMGSVKNGKLWSDRDLVRIGYYLKHEKPVHKSTE